MLNPTWQQTKGEGGKASIPMPPPAPCSPGAWPDAPAQGIHG